MEFIDLNISENTEYDQDMEKEDTGISSVQKHVDQLSGVVRSLNDDLYDIRLRVSNMEGAMTSVQLAVEKLISNHEVKTGKTTEDNMEKTPMEKETDEGCAKPRLFSRSPFLKECGGECPSKSQRKLNLGDTPCSEKQNLKQPGHTFDLRNIQFSKSQFPTGLVTLDEFPMAEEVRMKAAAKSRNGKSKPCQNAKISQKVLGRPEKGTPGDQTCPTPATTERRARTKRASAPKRPSSPTLGDQTCPTPATRVKRARTEQHIAKNDHNDSPLTKGAPNVEASTPKWAESDHWRRLDALSNSDCAESATEGPMISLNHLFEQTVADRNCAAVHPKQASGRAVVETSSDEVSSAELRGLESCLRMLSNMKPVDEGNYFIRMWDGEKPDRCKLRDSLSSLTDSEAHICTKIYEWSCKEDYAYNALKAIMSIEVKDCYSVFPDEELINSFVDMYLYNLQLENNECGGTKLYLPSLFQGYVLGCDESKMPGFAKYLCDFVDSYVPDKISHIDRVCFPMLDLLGSGHWFSVVIFVQEKKVILYDSMGQQPARMELVKDLITAASRTYRTHRLGGLLPQNSNYNFSFATTKVQQNSYDCGMYAIKYLEAAENSDCSSIFYSSKDMSVERLKYLASLISSKFNTDRGRWIN